MKCLNQVWTLSGTMEKVRHSQKSKRNRKNNRTLWNVLECSRMFRNVLECSECLEASISLTTTLPPDRMHLQSLQILPSNPSQVPSSPSFSPLAFGSKL